MPIAPTDETGHGRHRHARGHRGWLAPVAACVLALTGAGLLSAAAATQQGPPPSAPPAQAYVERVDPSTEDSVAGRTYLPGAERVTSSSRLRTEQHVAAAAQLLSEQVAAETDNDASDGESARPARVAPPRSLSVPSLDIDTELPRLGLDRDGFLEVPKDAAEAGWFELGTRPGGPGAAVIAGHVDSEAGPGVFYRLGELAEGAEIRVDLKDGETAVFAVDRVVSYPKDDLPTAEVYASTGSTLRLITCGGEWGGSEEGYRDNVVAYATLVETR